MGAAFFWSENRYGVLTISPPVSPHQRTRQSERRKPWTSASPHASDAGRPIPLRSLPSGRIANLFQSWTRHRYALTRAGRSGYSMRTLDLPCRYEISRQPFLGVVIMLDRRAVTSPASPSADACNASAGHVNPQPQASSLIAPPSRSQCFLFVDQGDSIPCPDPCAEP
jgi:hypothetical protein